MLIRADARAIPLRPGSVQTVVTSPPYLRQRRYGDSPDELGLEATMRDYVSGLVGILDQLRVGPAGQPGILRPDGLLWLNVGDKANGSGGAGGDWNVMARQRDRGPGRFVDRAYPEGTFLDVPGAIIRAMLIRGWRLRLPIVWDKMREAPESLAHVNRPRWQHEMILLFQPGPGRARFYPDRLVETGSIWRFPPGGDGDPHLAPFPDELAERCLLPSTEPGDLVLDPFAGSGTVTRVAERHGRRAIGLDLYAGLSRTESAS